MGKERPKASSGPFAAAYWRRTHQASTSLLHHPSPPTSKQFASMHIPYPQQISAPFLSSRSQILLQARRFAGANAAHGDDPRKGRATLTNKPATQRARGAGCCDDPHLCFPSDSTRSRAPRDSKRRPVRRRSHLGPPPSHPTRASGPTRPTSETAALPCGRIDGFRAAPSASASSAAPVWLDAAEAGAGQTLQPAVGPPAKPPVSAAGPPAPDRGYSSQNLARNGVEVLHPPRPAAGGRLGPRRRPVARGQGGVAGRGSAAPAPLQTGGRRRRVRQGQSGGCPRTHDTPGLSH